MIRIRDPLHGTVQLTSLEEKLLDSPSMQRLRGIRQLAMAYLVYPGANHTRFEHSIGTLFLADKICRELGVPKEKIEKVRLAALLHDIGHVAFSHEAEAVLQEHIGNHEKVGEGLMLKGEIAALLEKEYSPKEIASVYSSPLGEIITSDLGADRMDYLLRDSHYTGVAYGVIDADRICSSLKMEREGLALLERGLAAAENLLVARFTMFSTVYLHKTVRIASRMLQSAITLAIADGTLEPKDALELTDTRMLDALLRSPAAEGMVQRLKNRWLYKKAYGFPLEKLRRPQKEVEEMLSEKCGCGVLLDVPRLSAETSIMLETEEGKTAPLAEKSELVASLQRMQKNRLNILALCEEKNVRKVAAGAEKMFG